MTHERPSNPITGGSGRRPVLAPTLVAVCLTIAGCTTPPPESSRGQPEASEEPDAQASKAPERSDDCEGQGKPVAESATPPAPSQADDPLGELLTYYRRSERMTSDERGQAAARLRARMPTGECSAKRLKVYMLAIRQPDLLSEPDALIAPCLANPSTDRPELVGLARLLEDRFNGERQRRELSETNEALRAERNELRRRNSGLQEQLEEIKEIERSVN